MCVATSNKLYNLKSVVNAIIRTLNNIKTPKGVFGTVLKHASDTVHTYTVHGIHANFEFPY